jgi:glutathione synthase/RimK-type ligase-like ATP-grasp enzyme
MGNKAGVKGSIFGICTIHSQVGQLSYELAQVYREAGLVYDRVMLINPRKVSYMFVMGEQRPQMIYGGEDIAGLTSLLVRSTKNSEAAIAILVRVLKICGCDILDPVERFSVGKASKLLTTISRFQRGKGTSTYVSFTRTGSVDLLKIIDRQDRFPIIAKPISGKKGEGIELIENYQAGLESIDRYFGPNEYLTDPFFFQDFIPFVKEYRVLVIDGQAIGIAEKIKAANSVVANAAQGGTFVAAEAQDIVDEVLLNVSDEGMIGVDVAVDIDGRVHIIETNRAPQWQAFEKATGLNVARILVDRALKRI